MADGLIDIAAIMTDVSLTVTILFLFYSIPRYLIKVPEFVSGIVEYGKHPASEAKPVLFGPHQQRLEPPSQGLLRKPRYWT